MENGASKSMFLRPKPNIPRKSASWLGAIRLTSLISRQGETVEVSIDLESREYNGRWYTDVKAWKVSRDDATAGSPPPFADQDRYAPSSMDGSPIGNDDIPF